MTRDQLQRFVVGPIATVPTPFDAEYRIDYGRMAEATQHWVDTGLVAGRSVLKVAASIGEGHLLREQEWTQLLGVAVEAAQGRVPVVGAVHHKDTVRTIEDAKRAVDLGVLALQVSPPIFNLPSQEDLLRYFGALSETVEIGIIVYATPWLEHGAIFPDTLARMADFEHVVAVKWSPPAGVDYTDVFGLAAKLNILDNNNNPVRCHQLGGRGYLTDGVEAYPPFYLRLWDLMEHEQYDQAHAEWKRFSVPFKRFFGKVVTKSGSDAKVAKAMSKIMGLDLGPPRPPSVPLNEPELAELRQLMLGWDWPVHDS